MAVKPLYSRHQQYNASHIQEDQKSFSLISILMSAGVLFDREIILLWLQTYHSSSLSISTISQTDGKRTLPSSIFCPGIIDYHFHRDSEICFVRKVTLTKKSKDKPGEILMLSKVQVIH